MKLSSDFGEEYKALPDDMSRSISEWKKVIINKNIFTNGELGQFTKTRADQRSTGPKTSRFIS